MKNKEYIKWTIIPTMLYQVFIVLPKLIMETIMNSIRIPFKVYTDKEFLEELIKEIENENRKK